MDNQQFSSKTVASIFGEMVWLMSRSADHRNLSIAELEELVMPAILLRQFRIFYNCGQPVAAVLYARLSPEIQLKVTQEGVGHPLTFKEWQSGSSIHVVLAVSPFGSAEPFVAETLQIAQNGPSLAQSPLNSAA